MILLKDPLSIYLLSNMTSHSALIKKLDLLNDNLYFDKMRAANPLLTSIATSMPYLCFSLEKFFVAQSKHFPSFSQKPYMRLQALHLRVQDLLKPNSKLNEGELREEYQRVVK